MSRKACKYTWSTDTRAASCHTVLSAQLLRLQYEVRQPLYDSALSPTPVAIPYDDIVATAKSIRRTCLKALHEQFSRFQSPVANPFLPPPRFKVDFCPFADQIRKDLKTSKTSNLRTRKVKSKDRFDDRELCPHCNACISVTPHSGLPNYRYILFSSHVAKDRHSASDEATFACKSCYKTFNDSYAFLDHVFQKQVGSNRSCLKRASMAGQRASFGWTVNEQYLESDPSLVEQCLKNCLMRELKRVRTMKKLESQILVKDIGAHPSFRTSQVSS